MCVGHVSMCVGHTAMCGVVIPWHEWSTARVLQQSLSALHTTPHQQDGCLLCLGNIDKVQYLTSWLFPSLPSLLSLIPHTPSGHRVEVLQQSLSALHINGVADVAPLDSLPRLRDIDTVHDLTAWLAENRVEVGGEGVLEADSTVLSGCGIQTANEENASRAAHAGVPPTTHAPLGCVHGARVGRMEGGTDTQGLLSVVARLVK
ncbi:unnamed protein product, partial [Closterium sp. Naga37s-1]